MDSLNLSKCTATGKTRYYDSAAAKQAMSKLKAKRHTYDPITRKRIKHRHGKTEQCRYYYCTSCKGYHLTKIPAQVTVKKLKKYRKEHAKNNEGLVLTSHEALDWKADSLPFPDTHKNIV